MDENKALDDKELEEVSGGFDFNDLVIDGGSSADFRPNQGSENGTNKMSKIDKVLPICP